MAQNWRRTRWIARESYHEMSGWPHARACWPRRRKPAGRNSRSRPAAAPCRWSKSTRSTSSPGRTVRRACSTCSTGAASSSSITSCGVARRRPTKGPGGRNALFRRAQCGRDRRGSEDIHRNGHARLEHGQSLAVPGTDRRRELSGAWMTPDRFQEVDNLLQLVLSQPPENRDAILRKACCGDEALEAEVRSLMKSHEQAAIFLERPAIEVAARALAGEQSGETEPDLIGRTVSRTVGGLWVD